MLRGSRINRGRGHELSRKTTTTNKTTFARNDNYHLEGGITYGGNNRHINDNKPRKPNKKTTVSYEKETTIFLSEHSHLENDKNTKQEEDDQQ